MTIRPAVTSDAKALERIEKALFTEADFPLARHAFYYHIRRNLLFVAQMSDGSISGYILALVRRRHAKIYSVGVLPEYRGHGIASCLMDTLMDELAIRGFERTQLEVRCDNHEAIALYRNFGFGVVKTLKSFYRDGCSAYLMERDHAR